MGNFGKCQAESLKSESHTIRIIDFNAPCSFLQPPQMSPPNPQWSKNKAQERDSLIIFHLVPQLHDLHFDASLALMFQNPLIGLPVLRWSRDAVEVVRVVLLLTERRARRALSDLQVRRVFGDVSVRPADVSDVTEWIAHVSLTIPGRWRDRFRCKA
jgi:hypothetical protein